MSQIPGATYRLQFNQGFRFVDGRELVPYLSDLGITDMYSSPRYKARRGSSHGYDIANPLRVNSELGTEEDFDEMAEKLRHYGMGLLLDTVPNHMAASYENPWWTDVLENGQSSVYAGYFDIDWHPPTAKAAFLQDNRVLLPILGDLYGNVLAKGELAVKIEDTGIHVRYYDTRLPLDPKSYARILERLPRDCRRSRRFWRSWSACRGARRRQLDRVMERRREKERIKERLWHAYHAHPELKHAMDEALLAIAASVDELDALLSEQAYRLAYWKIGYEEINYRRFFDINELVGLKIETPGGVRQSQPEDAVELVRSGKVTGLRIDHIDGLWDPECFLRRLATKGGETYVVVEKILGREEPLPREWPVAGTTGYEFLNAVNGVFIDPRGLAKVEEIVQAQTGSHLPFAEICYQCNKLVIEELFRGDLTALARIWERWRPAPAGARHAHVGADGGAGRSDRVPAGVPDVHPRLRNLRERSRVHRAHRGAGAQPHVAGANQRRGVRLHPLVFCCSSRRYYLEDRKKEWLDFVMRWQQFTGPVMAKGLEDTATYRYNALLSMNEVGGDPLREQPPFDLGGVPRVQPAASGGDARHAERHGHARHQARRGFARARINVLTEIPEEWERRLTRWMEWNAGHKVAVNGVLAPTASEEILIYQTLLARMAVRDRARPGVPGQGSAGGEAEQQLDGAARRLRARRTGIRRRGSSADEERFLPDFREFHGSWPDMARGTAWANWC